MPHQAAQSSFSPRRFTAGERVISNKMLREATWSLHLRRRSQCYHTCIALAHACHSKNHIPHHIPSPSTLQKLPPSLIAALLSHRSRRRELPSGTTSPVLPRSTATPSPTTSKRRTRSSTSASSIASPSRHASPGEPTNEESLPRGPAMGCLCRRSHMGFRRSSWPRRTRG